MVSAHSVCSAAAFLFASTEGTEREGFLSQNKKVTILRRDPGGSGDEEISLK
jgi:hypothetical protein